MKTRLNYEGIINNNRRFPYEFWTNYLARTLKEYNPHISIIESDEISRDGFISYVWLDHEIKTNRGEVSFNKMVDFNIDVLEVTKKDLGKLSLAGYNEYFIIREIDKGEEWSYREFGFMIDDRNKVEITDHSSCWETSNFPGRNSWSDFPLIERYKNRKTGNPKRLIEDVIEYIKIVGVPSEKTEMIEKPKKNSSQRQSLDLRLIMK